MKEAFWYWDEVSLEIGKRIEKGTYLPLLSISEEALENRGRYRGRNLTARESAGSV